MQHQYMLYNSTVLCVHLCVCQFLRKFASYWSFVIQIYLSFRSPGFLMLMKLSHPCKLMIRSCLLLTTPFMCVTVSRHARYSP